MSKYLISHKTLGMLVGGLPNGPCGEEFKASFSCFHYSEKEPKGSDCYEQFVAMQVR